MIERLQAEIDLVRARYGTIEVGPDLAWFIIPKFPVPNGWNRTTTPVLVQIPPGYPVTPPDNFATASDLLLANGQTPQNSSPGHIHIGVAWLLFSFHANPPTSWSPRADMAAGHNLLTFLELVSQRLREAE